MKEKLKKENYNSWAMVCHLSYFIGSLIPIPFGSLMGPLIVWALKKNESELVRENGKSVLNFALSLWLYAFIAFLFIVIITVFCIFIPLFKDINFSFLNLLTAGVGLYFIIGISALFSLIEIILVIYGSIKAFQGKVYRYPFTIQFLKYKPLSSQEIIIDHEEESR